MEDGKLFKQKLSELRAAFAKFKPADFGNLRQRHRAADRMTEEGAGVNRLAFGWRPRSVHDIRAPDAGGKRKAAGERLAETDQIGHHAGMFARKPFSGAPKAGVNLVEDEQRAVPVAEFPQQRQKPRRRDIDAAARLNGFDENRANPAALKQTANQGFHDGEIGGFRREWDEICELTKLQARRSPTSSPDSRTIRLTSWCIPSHLRPMNCLPSLRRIAARTLSARA